MFDVLGNYIQLANSGIQWNLHMIDTMELDYASIIFSIIGSRHNFADAGVRCICLKPMLHNSRFYNSFIVATYM